MLKLSLKTLKDTLPYIPEIIIIANNISTKELDFELGNPIFKVFKVAKNLFWPGAINYGVLQSSGEHLLFCDPDIFYMPNWFESLLDCFFSHEDVGVVSPKIVNPLNNRIMDFGMAYNEFNTVHTAKGLLYNHPITLSDRKVQGACGAVFLTKRKYFDQVGGIDEKMPYIYCDNDYSLKLAKLGLSTWVASKSIVYHKGNTDSSNSKYEKFSCLREDSKAAFYAKNAAIRKIDFVDWLDYFWSWHKTHTKIQYSSYILLDFCTLPDHNEYIKQFQCKLGLRILETLEFSPGVRDIQELKLYNYVPVDRIASNVPFLYFVDDYTSLFYNKIWFSLRDVQYDLVIDRQCNIINMIDIRNEVV